MPARTLIARPMHPPLAPKAVFDQAIGLIDAGELGAAEERCRAALERYPRDVNMRALLGALLVKMERSTEAEATLREVIAAAPTFAKPHEDLGYLLMQANRPADALPLLERATRLDPSLERAWFTLGKALALARPREGSGRSLREILRAIARAAADGARGRAPERGPHRGSRAPLPARAARRTRATSTRLRLLALIAISADTSRRRRELCSQQAIAIAPDFMLAILDLGRLRKEQDRYGEALECFDRAIALEPAQPQAHYLRASTLARASFTHEAIAATGTA